MKREIPQSCGLSLFSLLPGEGALGAEKLEHGGNQKM
jgi:hypothetical protein